MCSWLGDAGDFERLDTGRVRRQQWSDAMMNGLQMVVVVNVEAHV